MKNGTTGKRPKGMAVTKGANGPDDKGKGVTHTAAPKPKRMGNKGRP